MRRLENAFGPRSLGSPEIHWVILGDPSTHRRGSPPRPALSFTTTPTSRWPCEQVGCCDCKREFPRGSLCVGATTTTATLADRTRTSSTPDEVEGAGGDAEPRRGSRWLRTWPAPAAGSGGALWSAFCVTALPDESLVDVAALDAIPLELREASPEGRGVLHAAHQLWSERRSPSDDAGQVSRAGGWDLQVVVHGHDHGDERFHEARPGLPVLFGAPRAAKAIQNRSRRAIASQRPARRHRPFGTFTTSDARRCW